MSRAICSGFLQVTVQTAHIQSSQTSVIKFLSYPTSVAGMFLLVLLIAEFVELK